MKTIRLLFLGLLFTVGFSIPSCSVDDDLDCNCPAIEGAFFDIQSLSLENCNELYNDICDRLDQIAWQDYILIHRFTVNYYGLNSPSNDYSFSLIPSAMACSCLENGFNGSEEQLTELTVITQNDFNDNYLAQDTINALLNIHINDQIYDLNTFLQENDKPIRGVHVGLSLKEKPSLDSTFQVRIRMTLDGQEEYLVESEEILLTD